MADEKILMYQPFLPFPRSLARSKEEALLELSRPCSRFRSPFTLGESFRLFLSHELGKTDPLGNTEAVLASGVPLNWQVLLRYLHEHGVITEPRFMSSRRTNDLPKTYGAELIAHLERSDTDGRLVHGRAYGNSRSAEIAMAKAVGEVLERYFLTLYKKESFVKSSYDALSKRRTPAVNIFDLNAFLPWQQQKNPRFARDAHAPLYWVKGETADGRAAYIPAQLVFWNYDLGHDKGEPILEHSTTNGAGGYFTKEEAVLSGLLEAIERDGFLIYWLNRLSPPVIDTTDIKDDDIQELLASLKRYGLTMHFLNTTTDTGVPSVISVLIDMRGEEPVFVIGGAAGFTLKETILRSGNEALNVLQILQVGTRGERFVLPKNYEPFTDFKIGQHERIIVWRGHSMLKRFGFFLEGKRQSPEDFLGAVPKEAPSAARLDYVLQKFKSLGSGYEVYLYEVEHTVLKTLGYHVVQTLVPQLFPMYLKENLPTLDSKRLREVPGKLGYKAAKTLNPWPHPFP